MFIIKDPKTEYMPNPVCVPQERVRFSWTAETDVRNQHQVAYQMILTKDNIANSMWGDHACASDHTIKDISPTVYL